MAALSQKTILDSIRIAVIEGCAYHLMVGFGENYFAPFALWLGAGPLAIGLLTTLPLFFGALTQFFCPWFIVQFASRKKFVLTFVLIQGFLYAPIALAPLLARPVAFLIAFVSLYQAAILVHVPAWNSWMADLVDETRRGEYFGFHKRATQAVFFAVTLVSGWLLNRAMRVFGIYGGFTAFFIAALLARMASAALMSRQAEPPLNLGDFEKIDYARELTKVKHNHLSRLVAILAVIGFSIYVSVPFFAPYMLEKLGWSYSKFAICSALVLGGRFLFSPAWGKLCDEYGCRAMLLVSSFGISTVPLYWLLSDNFYFLCATQVVAGLFWSGYELSWFNFMMDSTTRGNRAQFFSLQQVAGNLMMVLGAVIGGLILIRTGATKDGYRFVFLASSALRLIASFSIVFFIGEIRTVKKIPYRSFTGIFFQATKDRGIFYVPDVLKNRPR